MIFEFIGLSRVGSCSCNSPVIEKKFHKCEIVVFVSWKLSTLGVLFESVVVGTVYDLLNVENFKAPVVRLVYPVYSCYWDVFYF